MTENMAIAILLGLFGFVNCFFGYSVFRALLPIWGLLIGAVLGLGGVQELAPGNPMVTVVGAVVGGVAGGVLFSSLYFFGVFMVGAVFVALLTRTAFALDGGGGFSLPLIIGAGLAGGLAALAAQKLLIVMATSFAGAAALITTLFALLDYQPLSHYFLEPDVLGQFFLPALGGVLTLALVGVAVQLMATCNLGKNR